MPKSGPVGYENPDGHPVITINPKDANVILAPDLYKNLQYIILETNEDALVDGQQKTKLFEDYIGVLNQYPDKKFILFDRGWIIPHWIIRF